MARPGIGRKRAEMGGGEGGASSGAGGERERQWEAEVINLVKFPNLP